MKKPLVDLRPVAASSTEFTPQRESTLANPGVWFDIYVDDMAGAKAFYEAVLQVELSLTDMPGFQMLRFASTEGYGARGALVHHPDFSAGGSGTIIYFGCEDCAVEAERVVAAGGQVKQPKLSIGKYDNAALVTDTEGNMIGLHSMA